MKRFFCVILCVVIVVCPLCITASADPAIDFVIFLTELAFDWYNDTSSEVEKMSGNEFTNWLTSSDDPDSWIWWAINVWMANNTLNNPISTPWGNYGGGVNYPVSFDDVSEAVDGVYNTAELSREMLENSINALKSDYGMRYFDISDLGLTTSNSIDTSRITLVGDSSYGIVATVDDSRHNSWMANMGDNYFHYSLVDRYHFDSILLFNGAVNAPPLLFVPGGFELYQNGVLLPDNSFYIPISSTELLRCGTPADNFSFFYCPEEFNTGHPDEFGIIRDGTWESDSWIYNNGSVVGHTNISPYDCFSMVDIINKMCGYIVSVDDTLSPDNVFKLPDDIPYDDDDNVIVAVPQGGGDVVYLNPSTFNNYIDNGNITNLENYDYSVNGDTINEYITNNQNSDSDSSFDDSKIVSLLESIKSKIDTVIGLLTFDIITDLPDKLGIDDDDFDILDFELDFRSLIQSKLPLLGYCSSIISSLKDTNSPLVLECDNPANFILHTDKYDKFSVDFSWYDNTEYGGKSARIYVRDGISVIVYIFTFVALYRRTDSIFRDF